MFDTVSRNDPASNFCYNAVSLMYFPVAAVGYVLVPCSFCSLKLRFLSS